MSTDRSALDAVETVRRAAFWLASVVCTVAFLWLLALSATPSWSPDGDQVPLAHTLFRFSALAVIPLGFGKWVLGRLAKFLDAD